MTQSWLPLGADIPCSDCSFLFNKYFNKSGMHFWKLHKGLRCLSGFKYQQKSVRVGAKDIFPVSRNTFDKTTPIK